MTPAVTWSPPLRTAATAAPVSGVLWAFAESVAYIARPVMSVSAETAPAAAAGSAAVFGDAAGVDAAAAGASRGTTAATGDALGEGGSATSEALEFGLTTVGSVAGETVDAEAGK